MATIERRLAELERATPGGLLVILVDNDPTPEQLRVIAEAKARGRAVVRVSPVEAEL